MHFNAVIGQQRAKKLLHTAIRNGKLSHAYLFWGEEGIGKDALALAFAKTLLCEKKEENACENCASCKKLDILQHPDLKLIFPLPGSDGEKNDDDGSLSNDVVNEIKKQIAEKAKNPYFHIEIPKAKFIRIKSIRDIKKESVLSSVERGRKVFIIFDADTMNDAAANSLLKILEEPLDGIHFLLVSSRKDVIKQTIISRCQLLHCSILSDDEITNALIEKEHLNVEQAQYIAHLANGSYRRALELFNDDFNHYRSDAVKFLRSVLAVSSIKLFDEQEEYLIGNKRNDAEQLLMMMLLWMRDAIIVREHGSMIFNRDQEDDIKSFVVKFGHKNLEQCLVVVERSLELLRRNVYLPLVMLSLSVKLKQILIR